MNEIVVFIAGVFVGALLVALIVLAFVDSIQSRYFVEEEDLEDELYPETHTI